ncbi:MAG TPA: hypothetical protein PL033_10795 [Candidatus Brocadiia bacterium]|nr:hypothetical protein [Candidatus Brocadiia bacterium]
MAIESKGGWTWTAEEKQWVKTWQRDLYDQYRQVTEQVVRFQESLPKLAGEAAKAARPFVEACGPLLAIDVRPQMNKAQQVSPEQAEKKLVDANKGLKAWGEFVNRDDVVAAIRDANKDIRQIKRESRKARQDALKKIDGPEYESALRGQATKVAGMAQFYAQSVQFALGCGTAKDLPVLERLYTVCFVNCVAESGNKRAAALKKFVGGDPLPELDAVLIEALRIVTRDAISRWPTAQDDERNPVNKFASLAQQRLHETVSAVMKSGGAPGAIPKMNFTILKRDYSPS